MDQISLLVTLAQWALGVVTAGVFGVCGMYLQVKLLAQALLSHITACDLLHMQHADNFKKIEAGIEKLAEKIDKLASAE
jgi:hypothetical protein